MHGEIRGSLLTQVAVAPSLATLLLIACKAITETARRCKPNRRLMYLK